MDEQIFTPIELRVFHYALLQELKVVDGTLRRYKSGPMNYRKGQILDLLAKVDQLMGQDSLAVEFDQNAPLFGEKK